MTCLNELNATTTAVLYLSSRRPDGEREMHRCGDAQEWTSLISSLSHSGHRDFRTAYRIETRAEILGFFRLYWSNRHNWHRAVTKRAILREMRLIRELR